MISTHVPLDLVAPFGGLAGRLDEILDEAIGSNSIVGTVVLVSRGGNLQYERAAGFADREAQTPTSLDTIFRWASLTKPLVSACALALAERQVISLDDPIAKFIPTFTPRLADGETANITIHHLLTHTAGLSYRLSERAEGMYHLANVSDGLDQPGLSIEENLKRIGSVPLSFEPGAAWAYSVATDVLGEVLSRAAGVPLPSLVEKLIANPLGLSACGFTVADRGRVATAYADSTSEPSRMEAYHVVPFWEGTISFAPDRMFVPGSYPSGGAGMSGTARDFLRFLEAVRNGGAPILTDHSATLLASVATGNLQSFAPGWGWSLGWAILRDPTLTATPQSPGTWLWGGVYGSSWFVDPALKLSVVVMTNTATAGMLGSFPDAIRDAVYASIRQASREVRDRE
jgi:CubicO group peptidase (beta-lactamase class C family)